LTAAKVTSTSVASLVRPASADEVVTESDVQDPKTLARLINQLRKDAGVLVRERQPRRIDFEDVTLSANGTQVRLAHQFGGRARWSVIGWQAANPGIDWHTMMWTRRAMFGPATLGTIAGDYTVGSRFQATARVRVAGLRFPWFSGGATRTITGTLWRDSDGASLGSGTTTVNESGMYVVLFTKPVELDGSNLNVDLTAGVYDGGVRYTKTGNDAAFTGLLSLKLPGFLLKSLVLYSAGNARPTSSAATELYWVEPYVSTAPQLVEDTSTSGSDSSTLALKSYAPGVATIRVEEAG